MLTTFTLQRDVATHWKGMSNSGFHINPKGFEIRDTVYSSLKYAIEWAIVNNEDIIYCVRGSNAVPELDMAVLERVIYDTAPESIYVLLIDAKFNDSIVVNQDCSVISDIEAVSSFILVRPIYRSILALLEDQDASLDWLTFIRFIAPHSFALKENHSINTDTVRFHIVSPFRNAAPYLKDYLQALNKQTHPDYQVYMIDDYSTDNGSDLIDNAANVTKVINFKRKYALQNILDILLQQPIEDDDVICLIDADDRLPHKYVLSILNSVYQDKEILLTYGSMQRLGDYRILGNAYTPEQFEKLRRSPWKASHLRTFRFKLFKEFLCRDPELNHLKNADGDLLRMPYDMALLFPLMEIAGYNRTKFIPIPMYEYRLHGNNDHNVNRVEQYAGEMVLRNRLKIV